ncbi:hypothetical protein [Absidia glauca]|uniref:Uncharacterized protein n=1 Tax=Absidia glauca TaxID=4829 RepID=A0A168SBI0_ABSGL|nr:hypothetical protein [Absidia glauca]
MTKNSNANSPLEGNNNNEPSSRNTIDIHDDNEHNEDTAEVNTSDPLSPESRIRESDRRQRAELEKLIKVVAESYSYYLEEFQLLILNHASDEELNSKRPFLEVVQKYLRSLRVELLYLPEGS